VVHIPGFTLARQMSTEVPPSGDPCDLDVPPFAMGRAGHVRVRCEESRNRVTGDSPWHLLVATQPRRRALSSVARAFNAHR
jgi:hypothetical protein